MKQIDDNMRSRLWYSRQGLKPMKWDEIYDSEKELINDMLSIDASPSQPAHKIVRGYEYILSFQKRILSGQELTEKQMTQLKRLAVNIAFKKYIQG